LSPGTNTIAAYAIDNLTNSSVISNAIVFYSVTNKLTILVTDWPNKAKINSGILSPSLNGQMLQIGRNYTITATPGLAMHRFVGWAAVTNLTTPVFNTNATLTFMMQSNLTLVARFENPFFHLKGNWYGLFAEEPVVQRSAGYISISLAGITDTSVNKFSGKVMLAGVTSTFTARTAQFDINGHSSFVIPRVTGNLTVNLDLDVVNASTMLTGSVSTVNWTAPVTAYRALTNKTIGSLLRYTVAIPPDVNSPNSPIGYGFGTITLPASANVTMSGYLADGTTYTAQSLKLVDGWKLPLFANLYSKNQNALLWGWLQLTNGQPGVSGDIHWVRPAGIASQGLTAGFSNAVALIGSLYTNTASPSLNWTGPGTVFLYDDRYPGVTNNVQISGKIVTVLDNATFRNTNHLAVTISSGTGLVSGSFRNSTRRLTDTIRGVLLQNQGMAVGLRTGTNAGAFLMEQ
jgi:hypothetical protein